MPRLFVDSFFFIALLSPQDRCHGAAQALSRQYAVIDKVTSDPVLVELFAWAAGRGSYNRAGALALLDGLRRDDSVMIVRQTPELFDAGLALYRRRPDKGYSLTDAMSMEICRAHGIERVLTHDRHFAQEGFEVLL